MRLILAYACVILLIALMVLACRHKTPAPSATLPWEPPDSSRIPPTSEGRLIRYGRELIANTSHYLGPKGQKTALSNGMNCQNCHLDAGTKAWGNNYSAVYSTYPKYRDRSGTVETIYRRINDCLQRSLNGRPLDSSSLEMQAIYAYIRWLGQEIPKGIKPKGAGITDLPWLERAADTSRGRTVYLKNCTQCHGIRGLGSFNADSTGYVYPPLWGDHSYNTGAGLYRISRLAGYIKDNMPLGASHNASKLSNEEAWDVAAFINTQPRPAKAFSGDWPDISKKPFDHPFGPYADSFSTDRHKYGPYGRMQRH
jgi:thiosulfate dehydrogenase